MNQALQQCCQLLAEHNECDYSDTDFAKDVYSPKFYDGPAITTFVLAVISLLLIVFALKNLFNFITKRDKLDIGKSVWMNVLILFTIAWRFVYLLDGPIQLFSSSPGFSASMTLSFEIISICFLNLTLAYSSYTWVELILLYKRKWESPKIAVTIKVIFVVLACLALLIVLMTIVLLILRVQGGYIIPLIPLSVSSLINGIIFSVSSYNMGVNLAEIYDFNSRKYMKVKLIKALAIGVAFFTLIRVANDLSSYMFQNWQQKLNLESYCNQRISWSLYLFFISCFTDILPVTFFLMVFSPGTKQKRQQNSFKNSNSFKGSENLLWEMADSDSSGIVKESVKSSLRSPRKSAAANRTSE